MAAPAAVKARKQASDGPCCADPGHAWQQHAAQQPLPDSKQLDVDAISEVPAPEQQQPVEELSLSPPGFEQPQPAQQRQQGQTELPPIGQQALQGQAQPAPAGPPGFQQQPGAGPPLGFAQPAPQGWPQPPPEACSPPPGFEQQPAASPPPGFSQPAQQGCQQPAARISAAALGYQLSHHEEPALASEQPASCPDMQPQQQGPPRIHLAACGRQLGAGSSGAVFEALTADGRGVALKVMAPTEDPAEAARRQQAMCQEILATWAVQSAWTVGCYGYWQVRVPAHDALCNDGCSACALLTLCCRLCVLCSERTSACRALTAHWAWCWRALT